MQFLVRIIFVRALGKVLFGVDSLFTNILLALSIADSGISTAISFKLYDPIAKKDYKTVSKLMSFYKKIYNVLGVIVILIGLCIIPFLHFMINENISNIYLIFILYLITAVSTYFISYKNILLTADQSNYKVTTITCSTYIIMYLLQIIFLLLIPNFIIFIIIKIIMTIIQQLLINRMITKKYDMINFKSEEKIEKKEKQEMVKSIKAMYMHKIGNYLVTGTDTIIISCNPVLGVALVGVYTNYLSITSMLESIVYRGLNGITASYGDLAVSEDISVQENVFDIISFLSFFLFGMFTIGFIFLLTPFINICFGDGYNLDFITLVLICINFYLVGNLKSIDIVKEATGNFVSDRYAPIIQAIINLVISILLTIKLGIIGVVLGTLISTILVPMWNKPYIIYKNIFKKSSSKYFLTQFKYLITIFISCLITYYVIKLITISNPILSFLIEGIVIVVIYIILICILYKNNKNYIYIKKLVKNKLLKR